MRRSRRGYELDIIAAAVVGGASLSGGRASVVGAVLGAQIFGVLRNALAQIPGGTFADRLILGVAVLLIVVLDRIANRSAGPPGPPRRMFAWSDLSAVPLDGHASPAAAGDGAVPV